MPTNIELGRKASFEGLLSPDNAELLKRFKIGIDLDGTIVDLAPHAVSMYNKLHDANYTADDLNDPWDMANWYMKKAGCGREEAIEITKVIWNSRECIEGANSLEGATELLGFLEKYQIYYNFVTSRPFSTLQYTQNWLSKNLKEIKQNRLLLQTSETYNNNFKVEMVNAYNFDIFFEDMPEHAVSISNNTSALVVLVNQPHNRNFTVVDPRIIRPKGIVSEKNILYSFECLIDRLNTQKFNSVVQ